jgi:hypothetical protein
LYSLCRQYGLALSGAGDCSVAPSDGDEDEEEGEDAPIDLCLVAKRPLASGQVVHGTASCRLKLSHPWVRKQEQTFKDYCNILDKDVYLLTGVASFASVRIIFRDDLPY